MKTCSKCKLTKPFEEFSFKSKKNNTLQQNCKACQRQISKEWYRANATDHKRRSSDARKQLTQEYIDYKKTLSCRDCGDTRYWCLTFHHLDPSVKETAVSNLYNYSRERLMKEINKCVVLCHNCHATLHHYERHPKLNRND